MAKSSVTVTYITPIKFPKCQGIWKLQCEFDTLASARLIWYGNLDTSEYVFYSEISFWNQLYYYNDILSMTQQITVKGIITIIIKYFFISSFSCPQFCIIWRSAHNGWQLVQPCGWCRVGWWRWGGRWSLCWRSWC